MNRRLLIAPVLAVAVALPAQAVAAAPVASTSASKITVKAKLKKLAFPKASFTSSKGNFSATWVSKGKYKLAGKINGKTFTGSFKSTRKNGRFTAKGSGKLGSRSVKITGGGPEDFKTATLVLR